ncbi:hypothetical protein SBOR_9006 [Sclerotinia borealis F-4128]|uniref:Uncharacterized protein n=1 Tax=Sclerotinia borealis (strain F-4128) TaxID=1432307 RepID=W9C6T3_SCLBF|nr:hypothetical protein SBOR_9006 [Sclerotinia borealis F-4128]
MCYSAPSPAVRLSQASPSLAVASSEKSSKTSKLEALPEEIYAMIWGETIDTVEGQNVLVRCRSIGNSFETYSDEPKFNGFGVSRKSREWTKSQYNVAYLAELRGYTGPLTPLENLWLNPTCDRFCPVMEHEWTPEAFAVACEVMRVIKVSRIAVSDCSHSTGSLKSPWTSFYCISNVENWSLSYREIFMYTTKHNLDAHQEAKFVPWSTVKIDLNFLQQQCRGMQLFKARSTFKIIKAAEKAQARADEIARSKQEKRIKVDGTPTWLFENGMKGCELEPKMIVEVRSLDIWSGSLIENSSEDESEKDEDSKVDESEEDENSGDDVTN